MLFSSRCKIYHKSDDYLSTFNNIKFSFMQKKSHKRSLCVNTFETYQNPEIKKELTERGFCVYEYLDSKEFSDSIELKYLQ